MMGRLESLFFIPSPVGREKVVEDRMRVLICFDARPHLNPLPRGEDFGDHASGDAAIHAHVADLHLVRDVPRAMTAQFSNSNGGMTRSFSTVHGRSWTTKPRPARQSIRFTATRKRRAGVWP